MHCHREPVTDCRKGTLKQIDDSNDDDDDGGGSEAGGLSAVKAWGYSPAFLLLMALVICG